MALEILQELVEHHRLRLMIWVTNEDDLWHLRIEKNVPNGYNIEREGTSLTVIAREMVHRIEDWESKPMVE